MQQHQQHSLPCMLAEVRIHKFTRRVFFFFLPLEERLRLRGTDAAPETPPRKHLSRINACVCKEGKHFTDNRATEETSVTFPEDFRLERRSGKREEKDVEEAFGRYISYHVLRRPPQETWTSAVERVRRCRRLLVRLGHARQPMAVQKQFSVDQKKPLSSPTSQEA